MSDGNEAAARPGQWPDGMTGADGEFLLRSGSALELADGFRQLAVMAERYVEEHDMLAAGDIADHSVSARSVPGDVRERLTTQLSGITEGFKQRVQRYLDQLDPDSVRDQVTDPFQWMMAGLMGIVGQSVTEAEAALGDVSADNMLVSYLMQYSQAAERRPLLPVVRRALLITAVASEKRCSPEWCVVFNTTKAAPLGGGHGGMPRSLNRRFAVLRVAVLGMGVARFE